MPPSGEHLAAGERHALAGRRLLMLEKTRQSMETGAAGLILGRNVFQRSHEDSLRFVAELEEILAKYPS